MVGNLEKSECLQGVWRALSVVERGTEGHGKGYIDVYRVMESGMEGSQREVTKGHKEGMDGHRGNR